MEPKYYADGEDAYAMKRDLTQMADEVSVLRGQGHGPHRCRKARQSTGGPAALRGSWGSGDGRRPSGQRRRGLVAALAAMLLGVMPPFTSVSSADRWGAGPWWGLKESVAPRSHSVQKPVPPEA